MSDDIRDYSFPTWVQWQDMKPEDRATVALDLLRRTVRGEDRTFNRAKYDEHKHLSLTKSEALNRALELADQVLGVTS